METLTRGFSNTFINVNKDKRETESMKYIEGSDLERTWKRTRRERHKDREEKIWATFMKEQEDLFNFVLEEDAYQFLDVIPEAQISELIVELKQNSDKEKEEAARRQKEEQKQKMIKRPVPVECSEVEHQEYQRQQRVTFADEQPVPSCDASDLNSREDLEDLEIVDSETDMDALFGSSALGTVRERDTEYESSTRDIECYQIPTSKDHGTSPIPPSTPPSEESPIAYNVRNMVENSTYNIKIKDIRAKLKEEIKSLIKTIDNENFYDVDAIEMNRRLARNADFSNRFQRIYLYQLHRQMYDIQRHSSLALPFAKHTHYQAQMMRAVSLHQNLLQAFRVLHKSIASTGCVRESAALVSGMSGAARQAAALCAQCATPPHLANVVCYTDLNTTLDSLEVAKKLQEERVKPIIEKISSYVKLSASGNEHSAKHEKAKQMKKLFSVYQTSRPDHHNTSKSRLAMYGSSGNKGSTGGGQAGSRHAMTMRNKKPMTPVEEVKEPAPAKKKTKSSRRPLMRNPHVGKPRRRRHKPGDADAVPTMVEAVPSGSRDNSGNVSPILELRQIYNEGYKSEQNSSRRSEDSPWPWRSSPRGGCGGVGDGGPTPACSPRRLSDRPPATPAISSARSGKAVDVTSVPSSARKLMINKSPATTNLGVPSKSMAPEFIYQVPKTVKEALSQIESANNGVIYPPIVNKETRSTSPHKNKKEECEVSRLLHQLCGGENIPKNERVTGTKNAQLHYVNSTQPNTPHLLKILEETIQKKDPKYVMKNSPGDAEKKYQLALDIGDEVTERMFQYRTKFVQHMLTSSMYANSSLNKPWQAIGTIADEILEDLLLGCAKDMEISNIIKELYDMETTVTL